MNPTYPIQYYSNVDIASIPIIDNTDNSMNKYGLYFPTQDSHLNITGFPSTTFTGNWTIEFFIFVPPSGVNNAEFKNGQIIGNTFSTDLPIDDVNDVPPAKINIDGMKTGLGFKVGLNFANGKPNFINAVVNTLESRGSNGMQTLKSSRNLELASYSGNWFSIVIQYDKNSSTSNYSILATPKGGSTENLVDSNSQQSNFGTQGAMNTLVLGGTSYSFYDVEYKTGPSNYYITNLRISNIVRYPNPPLSSSSSSTLSPTTTPTTLSTPILLPDDPIFKPDSNTIYFNSFNIPNSTNSRGYLLSQIIQIPFQSSSPSPSPFPNTPSPSSFPNTPSPSPSPSPTPSPSPFSTYGQGNFTSNTSDPNCVFSASSNSSDAYKAFVNNSPWLGTAWSSQYPPVSYNSSGVYEGKISTTYTNYNTTNATSTTTTVNGEWIQMKYNSTFKLTQFSFLNYNDGNFAYVTLYTLLGSTDGTNWEFIKSDIPPVNTSPSTQLSNLISITASPYGNRPYSYYRLVIQTLYPRSQGYCTIYYLNFTGLPIL
jgi:hypothetical protein